MRTLRAYIGPSGEVVCVVFLAAMVAGLPWAKRRASIVLIARARPADNVRMVGGAVGERDEG